MAKITIEYDELVDLAHQLWAVGKDADRIAARALYKGAGKAADGLRAATNGLTVVSDRHRMGDYRAKRPGYLSVTQKAGLLEGLGITSFKFSSDSVSTNVGFGGMNGLRTRKWPGGQPNRMIAAAVNHGDSSAMIRQPFITSTAEVYAEDIKEAMVEEAKAEIEKILDS